MENKYYEELKMNTNPRENLSLLRKEIKDPDKKRQLLELVGDGALLIGLLSGEDPKVRKNAALLLGDLEMQSAAEALFAAYRKETTLFVKSAYLMALGRLDTTEYFNALKECLDELTETEPEENEKKHIDGQILELRKMITGHEGIKRHTFTDFCGAHEILFTTNREQRETTLEEMEGLPDGSWKAVRLHPLGVLVNAEKLAPFTILRTCREILFPIHREGHVIAPYLLDAQPVSAAVGIWESELPGLLAEWHREQEPFYFRLELKARMELDKKTIFARRFAAELMRLSGGRLINSTSEYELEIRLIENRDGRLSPFFKLSTIPDTRFAYRRHAAAASIHPAAAAMLVELAKPWLKEEAQILDPFCGVGTMLIERDIRVPAREIYGIDIFGDAVRMARENAAAAGKRIHFINRDYFDFRHDYAFDEIITNPPVRGRRTKEEMDAFYASFFEKSKELLAPDGVIILYSNEEGHVKKQLRLHPCYRLIREFCVREKEHFYLYVIGLRIG